MSYFLRQLVNVKHISDDQQQSSFVNTADDYSRLIGDCLRLPVQSHTLNINNRSINDDNDIIDKKRQLLAANDGIDSNCFELDGAPSSFGAFAIARTIVLRYTDLLTIDGSFIVDDDNGITNQIHKQATVSIVVADCQIVSMALNCLFSVVEELNRREPDLCCQALTSLLQLLQGLCPEALHNQSITSLQTMFNLLRRLRINGCADVSSISSASLAALSIAYGQPELLLQCSSTLICEHKHDESINPPDNQRRLNECAMRLIDGDQLNWWSSSLINMHILCAFDIMNTNNCESSTNSSDNRRLYGSIACDGAYIYILNCDGLFKLGSGFGETIIGRQYASNSIIRSSRGVSLTVCNGSLYLRRRQSSKIWVIDLDCLREIGEIILNSNVGNGGAIVCDGQCFYLANIDNSSNLVITQLDDTFNIIDDTKQRQRYRIVDLCYTIFGDQSILSITNIPQHLLSQTTDIQIAKEFAVLLARTGKVYYSGNASRIGLHDTNGVWMELVLSESIVSINIGNIDASIETIVLRSGSGNIWIVGVSPLDIRASPAHRQLPSSNNAKLRRLHMSVKRKCVSIAVGNGCIVYVTDNGRVYATGRHTMHCHSESGLVFGLEHVHIASIACGKTHTVAISRHGHVYTWGLNNLNQCGRQEIITSTQNVGATAINVDTTSLCAPLEHLWVKDVATICVVCGQCTARGARCSSTKTISRTSPARGTSSICTCGPGESGCLRCGVCRSCGERANDDQHQQRIENDHQSESGNSSAGGGATQRLSLSPCRILLRPSNDIKVSSVSCGNYHTIVLAADRQVFSFGSNCHGQLGVGDTKRRCGPQRLEFVTNVQPVQIAAGANHCVLRALDGTVYTFGAFRQGQLARRSDERNWNARPDAVPGYGPNSGQVANWCGAVGDVTLILTQTQIFNNNIIADSQITTNNQVLMIFPNQVGKDYVVIRRKFATGFNRFSLGTRALYASWCLDSTYNIMWNYNAAQNRVEAICRWHRDDSACNTSEISFIKSPEFWIPSNPDSSTSSIQLGINLLATIYTITTMSLLPNKTHEHLISTDVGTKDDNIAGNNSTYCCACRFDSFGGGWGYSSNSVEAIQFQSSRDILLVGVGLFGGRGEYIARLRLLRGPIDAQQLDDQQEPPVEQLDATDEMLFECSPKEKAHLMFTKPILCQAAHWYIICAQINGPSSDCGANGVATLTADDGTVFTFRNSHLSNNGTDTVVGQIPELLYHSNTCHPDELPSIVSPTTTNSAATSPMTNIRPQSLLNVTPTTITCAFDLLRWSITNAFNIDDDRLQSSSNVVDTSDERTSWLRERAIAVGILALRLIRIYIRSLYPVTNRNETTIESPSRHHDFTDNILQLSLILNALFDTAPDDDDVSTTDTIYYLIDEAIDVYVQCSHVLLPCAAIVQHHIAILMGASTRRWSLVALLRSLTTFNRLLPGVLANADTDTMSSFPDLTSKMLKVIIGSGKRHQIANLQTILRFLFEIAFSSSQTCTSVRLRTVAQRLIERTAGELVTSTIDSDELLLLLQTQCRFRRKSLQPNWEMSAGVADAIAFRVDHAGVSLNGNGSNDHNNYTFEVLVNNGDAIRETWHVIDKICGLLPITIDNNREISFIKLKKSIRLHPGCVYAIRLAFANSLQTFCGENGYRSIRLQNGIKLHYQPCTLSANGTSVARGQFPSLLYSLNGTTGVTSRLQHSIDHDQMSKWFVVVLRMLANKLATLITETGSVPLEIGQRALCSHICAYTMLFLETVPQKAIDVMATLDELIPMVAALNGERASPTTTSSGLFSHSNDTRNGQQTIVESSHPYRSGTITSQLVTFDDTVHMICVKFDDECRSAQVDDTLWLYIAMRDETFVPVGRYSGSKQWPEKTLLLPGNRLWFVFETSVLFDEVSVSADKLYGYRCTLSGLAIDESNSSVLLEQELTFICASACRQLVQVPKDGTNFEALAISEEETHELIQKHGSLLRKGLNLSHMPTVNELLKHSMPGPAITSELKFLREFIAASGATVAGFLSRWMFSESVIDLQSCELFMADDEIRVGRSTEICLLPHDQYGRLALCSQMSIEVTVRSGAANISPQHSGDGVQQPILPTLNELQTDPYRPVYLNKARYNAITMMEPFHQYSFEEMRLGYFRDAVLRETVRMSFRADAAYVGTWMPKQTGIYRVECRLDGFQLPQSYQLEVLDASASITDVLSMRRTKRRTAQLSRARLAVCNPRIMSKGVRVRTAPNLSAQQIGIVPRGSVISYIEEIENSDGTWLRLTEETSVLHCDTRQHSSQAWCQQYSQHLQRTLLIRNCDQDQHQAPVDFDILQSIIVDSEEVYESITDDNVVTIYSTPSMSSATVETIDRGELIHTNGWLHNREGIWLRIDDDKYVIAQTDRGIVLLQRKHQFNLDDEPIQSTNNGNGDEPTSSAKLSRRRPIAQVHPRPSQNGKPVKSISPSIADCCRTVFAAFIWHERLVKDAMACSAYLKYHPELHRLAFGHHHLDLDISAPAPLQPLMVLWQEISSAVQMSIDQHLIMPSPPAIRQQISSTSRPSSSNGIDVNEELCELCEQWHTIPITTHMRMAHAGCGGHSGGQGYNSVGKYTSGWSGNCGDGGRANATWYLMCVACRTRHLRSTRTGQQHERRRRWRAFRLNAGDICPQTVIKQNAQFLLELNQSSETDSRDTSTNTSGWTINLFPQPMTPPTLRSATNATGSNNESKTIFIRTLSHASDPGPKHRLTTAGTNSISHCCELPPDDCHLQSRRRLTSEIGKTPNTSSAAQVVRSPSSALKSLIKTSGTGVGNVLRRPVLAFVIEHHDLNQVRDAMRLAINRATLFSHSFRVWNWLLRLVSNESSVGDIIWHYLTAFESYRRFGRWYQDDIRLSMQMHLIIHPWRICFLAGPIANKMVTQFHSFLYTISVILQSNCVNSSLRCLCFRAWTFQLTMHEQDLLILTCNILATVGQVLSDPSSDQLSSLIDESTAIRRSGGDVAELHDLTAMVHIETSSRPSMAVCLIDGSMDTFWESGDEDKNRTKSIVVSFDQRALNASMIAIYVDNTRDEGYRILSIAIATDRKSNRSTDILESGFIGWIKCNIRNNLGGHIIIELKGVDTSIRLRQLRVLGFIVDRTVTNNRSASSNLHQSPSHQMLFSSAQTDAFALFQGIAAQAFSDELAQEQNGTLRQQVLELLFSRVQLQPLQTYVCSQIVNALEREIVSLRDKSKKNYSYACGLMLMLVRICSCRHGLEIFSARSNLLSILSQLLLFAPQVVQLTTIETIERVIRLFRPETVDISTLMHHLLGVVAKVATLQVRNKSNRSLLMTANIQSVELVDVPAIFRIDRVVSIEIGRLVSAFIVDTCNGTCGDAWSTAFRTEVANNIMYISTVPKSDCCQSAMLQSFRFWLSISALGIIGSIDWLHLSPIWQSIQRNNSTSMRIPDPLCDNHDDGRTIASLFCDICQLALCRECYSVLHLNKRNRSHRIHTIGVASSSSPQIELHEGCARLRFGTWLLVLFHRSTLNGMVEFGDDDNELLPIDNIGSSSTTSTGICRFCSNPIIAANRLNMVCSQVECVSLVQFACTKTHNCGHMCGGIVDERVCLPCLKCGTDLRQDADDLCVICFTDRLGAAPSVQLKCGHVFHYMCVKNILIRRWSGARITFGFMQCALCKQMVEHAGLDDLLVPLRELYREVADKAKLRLEYDGVVPAITSPNSEYYQNPELYAIDKYVYVLCFKCGKAYFGGESQCQRVLDNSEYNAEELICGACSNVSGAQICPRHGVDYLEYKCRFCCSVAVYFCFGTTHFCTSCHDNFQRLMSLTKEHLPQCPVGPKSVQLDGGTNCCPLKIEHPPTGEEFALGCGICRNLSTF